MSDTEKRERFERLATKRTQAVLEKLDVLENCANKNNYEYNKEDVEKIFSSIQKKVKQVKSEFDVQEKEEVEFEL